MGRAAMAGGLAVLGGVLFSGCQRPEPLELRVSAETPYEFISWQERVMARQPEGVAAEFAASVGRIVATSPSGMALRDPKMMHSRYHPICRQLDGRSVREILIAGYSAANEALLRGIIQGSDNLMVMLKYDEVMQPDERDRTRLERMVDRRSAMIAAARAQVESNRRRIEELKAQAARESENFFVRLARGRVLMFILP